MSERDIDNYLAGLDEPKRSTLEALRQSILEVVPTAEQCISYGMPAFKVGGKVVAGFAAFKQHLSYLPHSGSVLPALADDVAGYERTKGSLHFPIDEPLPKWLVKNLVTTRLQQLGVTLAATPIPMPRRAAARRSPVSSGRRGDVNIGCSARAGMWRAFVVRDRIIERERSDIP